MASKKDKQLEPLTEGALKKAILDLQDLNEEYKELDKRYDALAAKILATMPPKDVRQYGALRCVIVQAMTRRVSWKDEALKLARRLYPTAAEFRRFLVRLVRDYPKKANKPSIKLSVVKTAED